MSENSTVAVSATGFAAVVELVDAPTPRVGHGRTGASAVPETSPGAVPSGPQVFTRRQQHRQFHRSTAAAVLGLGALIAMVLAIYSTTGWSTLVTVGDSLTDWMTPRGAHGQRWVTESQGRPAQALRPSIVHESVGHSARMLFENKGRPPSL